MNASRFDPELATIRAVANLAEGQLRSELLGARLALYNAIASGNRALANRWAATTHAALAALEVATGPGDGLVAVRAALRSLASIQRGIGGEP